MPPKVNADAFAVVASSAINFSNAGELKGERQGRSWLQNVCRIIKLAWIGTADDGGRQSAAVISLAAIVTTRLVCVRSWRQTG
eukprot:scaffold401140_cov34-Prasinocladus_malaysianus.AAC.1